MILLIEFMLKNQNCFKSLFYSHILIFKQLQMKNILIILLSFISLSFINSLSAPIQFYRDHIEVKDFNFYVDANANVHTFEQQTSNLKIPDQFWWGNISGKNFLTYQRNQRIPYYCSSSWAFAATSALNDRIKIKRNAQWPDIILSPQILLSCSQSNLGCKGGDSKFAYLWIKNNNITDQTCSPYRAKGYPEIGCNALIKCQNCWGECWVQPRARIYGVSEYGTVIEEENMKKQILENGPITCVMAVTDEVLNYTQGIFNDKTGRKQLDHDISITGWGQQNGIKFWIIRNSWGTYWGEEGNMRLIRGINNLGIQSSCSWAKPTDTWTNDIRNETQPKENYTDNFFKSLQAIQLSSKRPKFNVLQQYVVSPRPHQYLNLKQLPVNFDWRNVNGTNWLSGARNQNLPHYCGSCWAHAATGVIADRIGILRNKTYPQITLSIQELVNCYDKRGCNGGNPLLAYAFIHKNGVSEESCFSYTGLDSTSFPCNNQQKCMNCGPSNSTQKSNCWAQKTYTSWKIKQYGKVYGVQNIKAQIFARGPITCGIDFTNKLFNYTGGIFSQVKFILNMNHQIAIVGWGQQNGVQYWIGRNSWGTFWGQFGFFRIQMHKHNLGVQLQCTWAAVDPEPHIVNQIKPNNKKQVKTHLDIQTFEQQ